MVYYGFSHTQYSYFCSCSSSIFSNSVDILFLSGPDTMSRVQIPFCLYFFKINSERYQIILLIFSYLDKVRYRACSYETSIFYSKRKNKLGYTLYGSGHYQNIYDPDDDDFSNLPETKTFSFNPKFQCSVNHTALT